jgi:hypothetical protein
MQLTVIMTVYCNSSCTAACALVTQYCCFNLQFRAFLNFAGHSDDHTIHGALSESVEKVLVAAGCFASAFPATGVDARFVRASSEELILETP